MKSKLYIFLFWLICCAGFLACADQEYDYTGSNESVLTPEGKIRVPLNVIFPDFEEVQTRTVNKTDDEKKLHSIGVLVFEASSASGLTDTDRLLQKNFVNLEAIYGSQLSDKAYVELDPLAEDCHILVYANLSADAQSRLNAAMVTLTENNANPSKWGALKNFGLTLSELYKDAAAPGGAYTNLSLPYPMSSNAIYLSDISPATTNNLEIPLHMSFARIDVYANKLNNFVLHSAMPLSAEKTGNLWHMQNRSFTSDRTASYGETSVTAPGSGIISPVYIFPTSVPAENAGADSQATDLILKGDYTDASGKKYSNSYYKIRIRYSLVDKELYIINPNTLYKINLSEVKGPGYQTIEEAKANKPQNIKYDVVIDNTNNTAMDLVISNGAYYLGVSNSEYVVYSDQVQNKLVVTTLSHNAPATVSSASVELNGPGLSLVSGDFVSLVGNKGSLSKPDGKLKQTMIHLNMDPNLFTLSSIGTLSIRVGDLVKKIQIKRRSTIAGGFHIVEDFVDKLSVRAEYTEGGGCDWIKFSGIPGYTNALRQSSFDNIEGNIYCYFLLNKTSATRFTSIYIGRSNSDGRLKADFFQPPVSNIPEDIWDIQLQDYDMDAHYDFRPIMIRAKKGHTSIRLVDQNNNSVEGNSSYNWVRLSDALKYPGTTSNRLKTYLSDINHENNNEYSLTTMMLYADEYIDLTKARTRDGKLKFCYTVYDDPKLLESEETLSFLPIYIPFYQSNIVNLGLFGGNFSMSSGYTKKLGIENIHENLRVFLKNGYDRPLNPVPWGVKEAINTTLNDGLNNTIKLYNAYGTNPLPENPLDMVHNTYAAAYCMYKNRDLNGDGKIEGPEVKWYLPARNNMIGVNIFINSNLFLAKPPTDKSYYTSSDRKNTVGSFLFFNHFQVHYNSLEQISKMAERIRCVRDLD